MQTLLGKNNLQTISYNLYRVYQKNYKESPTYKDLSNKDKAIVDRSIFNWIRQDFY